MYIIHTETQFDGFSTLYFLLIQENMFQTIVLQQYCNSSPHSNSIALVLSAMSIVLQQSFQDYHQSLVLFSLFQLLTEDSSLEELPEVELESFPDTYRNLHESFEEIKIESVINIDPYLCCTNIKCNNKKLATRKEGDQYKMFCQGCNSTISASKANHYAVGKFGIIRNKTELQEVSMFLPEIKKIMESTGRQLEFSFKPEEFMIHILSALPITVTCRLKGKVVSKVIPKHKLNE